MATKPEQNTIDLSLIIDSVDAKNLSVEDFKNNYFIPQKPLLIKGLGYQQAAGKKWTPDFFREKMGDETVEIFDDYNKTNVQTTYAKSNLRMQLREFLNIIETAEHTPLRIFAFNLYKRRKELREDFQCPDLFRKGFMKNLGLFFIAGKNSKVRLHYDVDCNNNLLTQFYGRKLIVLFDPKYSPFLYKLPFNTHSIVDLEQPDLTKFKGLKYVKGYRFIQEPGDALFMPARWWHFNTYLEVGFAVSYRRLNKNPLLNLFGILNLGFVLPLDKLFTIVFRDRWFAYKSKTAMQRVERYLKKTRVE